MKVSGEERYGEVVRFGAAVQMIEQVREAFKFGHVPCVKAGNGDTLKASTSEDTS